MMSKRVGLFGGTFNPIHLGHIQMAEVFYDQMALDQLTFIPAGQPYHKSVDRRVTAQERYQMVELALSHYPEFNVSDCEIMRVGDTYTVETLEMFREQMGSSGEIWWLLGSDSLFFLHEWFEFEKIFQLANIAIVSRERFEQKTLNSKIDSLLIAGLNIHLDNPINYGKVRFLEMVPYDISSSQIRQFIAEGKNVDEYLPKEVIKYIKEHKLYI